MTTIVGIDPGISGAIAMYDPEGQRMLRVADMPITAKSSGKGNQVAAHALAIILRDMAPTFAVVEQQGAMPGQGVTSMLSLGRTLGVIEGVLAALEIPYVLVQPQAWKKRAGLKGADKDKSRTLAMQMFPGHATDLARKLDHGRAEAMLIARFGANDSHSL